jgi:hypothetical protein
MGLETRRYNADTILKVSAKQRATPDSALAISMIRMRANDARVQKWGRTLRRTQAPGFPGQKVDNRRTGRFNIHADVLISFAA